jgi:hypothetical protein
VTGGGPLGIGSSEAEQMKLVLENDFHVPVKWVENASNNTRENAYKSFAVLGSKSYPFLPHIPPGTRPIC